MMDEVKYEAHVFMFNGRKLLRQRGYKGMYGSNLSLEVKIDNILIQETNKQYDDFVKKQQKRKK